MSNVLFAAAVARRAGVDVETANTVIEALSAQIRAMAQAGSGTRLTGVGTFKVKSAPRGARVVGTRELTFEPVASLANMAPVKL